MASSVSGPVTFTKDDVEIIARETLYDGFFRWSFIVFVIACLMAV